MKKICFLTTTEGCATNLLENATYRKHSAEGGLEVTEDSSEADIIIVNTCAYTSTQEERSLDLISQLQSKYPEKEVVVGGCLTKINPESLGSVHKGFTFKPADYESLNSHLGLKDIDMSEANFFDAKDFVELSWVHRIVLKVRPVFNWISDHSKIKFSFLKNIFETSIVNTKYFGITVSQGCAGKCTFCAIKNAKGYVKSKSSEEVKGEFIKGLEKGYDKFWLLGDDIGCFGIDRGETFVDLLRKLQEIPQDYSLIINYFEPYFFLKYFDELRTVLADKRILNLNLPIQSGNKKVVRKMGREYDPHLVLEKLAELKKINPNLVVKTNIITSFPGETWSQFLDSVKSVFAFDAILALDYTKRPGTGADKYKNHLSPYVKKIRLLLINCAIMTRHLAVFLKAVVRA
ncbi:radical SAM protein [Halobacteriovorax marinus]|uniref:radical SAM protein n=1 Tax=Halobacteriovorax marinus TaxID=97084 RepID=UPI003A916CF5